MGPAGQSSLDAFKKSAFKKFMGLPACVFGPLIEREFLIPDNGFLRYFFLNTGF